MDQRSELTEVKAEREVMEQEVHDQLLQLHSLQLQLYAKQGQAEDSDTIKDRLVGRTSQARIKLYNTTALPLTVKESELSNDRP